MLTVTLEPSGEIRMKLQPVGAIANRLHSCTTASAKSAGSAHLSIAMKSEKAPEPAAGFGRLPNPTTFGSHGRRAVRNGCGALATLFGTRVVFGTITLPGSTPEASQGIARQSGRLIQLLTHWIYSKDKNALLTYVWEWQKRGALHLHFAVGSQNVLVLRLLERSFRSYVHKLFETLSTHDGTDLFARSDGQTWHKQPAKLRSRIETIRKSVKQYMAKYLTKAEAVPGAHYPSRWWGMSARLRANIRALRCCTVFRDEDWGCLVETAEQVSQALQRAKVRLYSYPARFDPSIVTWLVYAPDEQTEHLFTSIIALAEHVSASRPNVYDSRSSVIKPVSMRRLLASAGC